MKYCSAVEGDTNCFFNKEALDLHDASKTLKKGYVITQRLINYLYNNLDYMYIAG